MKRFIILLCMISLVYWSSVPAGEFFDDFNYRSADDPLLDAHGWTVVDGRNAPPAGAVYSRALIRFALAQPGSDNRIMILGARTDGQIENIELSRIENRPVFREGTYAAQLFFDHALRRTLDGNVQTFYLISPFCSGSDSLYSECDAEYLPCDVWSGPESRQGALHFTTWEIFRERPFKEDKVSTLLPMPMPGWHILIIRIAGGRVAYYLDKSTEPSAVHEFSRAGSTVYPESFMHLNFANWLTSTSPDFTWRRESSFKVDWVYHAEDTVLVYSEIMKRVDSLRANSLFYANDLHR